ncbi:hypothetical protein NEOLEDRAFT_569081 [Neolentinus lepideus HHB14362 ss-1]|uniref:Secreted protein n=1 Tax=Neolentinus lepideus HHB14362 ss-1 TaxID=1314782 RepID=A0A165QYW8_9AGAM|nr:hypothetical protein NEOLEDRAFT_569081 [Neolentinus lepideus HHB14362 ss-1]
MSQCQVLCWKFLVSSSFVLVSLHLACLGPDCVVTGAGSRVCSLTSWLKCRCTKGSVTPCFFTELEVRWSRYSWDPIGGLQRTLAVPQLQPSDDGLS